MKLLKSHPKIGNCKVVRRAIAFITAGIFILWNLILPTGSSCAEIISAGTQKDETAAAGTSPLVLESSQLNAQNMVGIKNDIENQASTEPPRDDNANGIPDWWEIEHFGNLDQKPGADYDSDGLTNIEEYRSHTDPIIENSNVALHATYDMSPIPHYIYCSDGWVPSPGQEYYPGDRNRFKDSLDLTDGEFAPPGWKGLWMFPGSCGWYMAPTVIITMDLKTDQPIAAIKYNTVSHADNGIYWPSNIYVLASSDGQNYYYLTDMIRSDPNIPPNTTGKEPPLVYTITSCGLDTHGRYLKFVIYTNHTYIDEIQVIGGGRDLPYWGGAIQDVNDEIVNNLRWKSRMHADIDMLNDKAASAGIDLSKELASITSRVDHFDDYYDELSSPDFESVYPHPMPAGYTEGHDSLGKIERDLINLNGLILNENGFSGLTVWLDNRWDPLDCYTSPDNLSQHNIDLNMMNGERRGYAINFTNAGQNSQTMNLNISGLSLADNPDWIRVYKIDEVDSCHNYLSSILLTELYKDASGYTFEILSGMTEQLWIEFAPASLRAGSNTGTIEVNNSDTIWNIPLNLNMSKFVFPDKLSLSLGMWDYLECLYPYYDGGSYGGFALTPENAPALKAILKEYKYDSYWASNRYISAGTIRDIYFDADDNLTLPDWYFNNFDRWMTDFPDMNYYVNFTIDITNGCTFAGVSANLDPDHPEIVNPHFTARVKAWADAFEDHMNSLGIAPDRIAFGLIDEPGSVAQQTAIINFGKAVRDRPIRYGSRIQIFEDMSFTCPGEQALIININGETMYTVSDIICPGEVGILEYDAQTHMSDFLTDMVKNDGKRLQFYSAGGHDGGLDPYGYELLREWIAFKYGADTINYWSVIHTSGEGNVPLNCYLENRHHYSPLYFDGPDVYSSKYFEAILEGREDCEYLKILSDLTNVLITKHPNSGQLIWDSQAILDEAVTSVTAATFNKPLADLYSWNIPKDRSSADVYRNKIWKAINSIMDALNPPKTIPKLHDNTHNKNPYLDRYIYDRMKYLRQSTLGYSELHDKINLIGYEQ